MKTSKTKIVVFEKRGNTQFNFMYDDKILDSVNNFRYLGVTLFKNGKWFQTQKSIAQRSRYSVQSN